MKTTTLIFYITILCFCFIMLKKNNRTYKMRMLVCDAIHAYNHEQIRNGHYEEILAYEYETYNQTFCRLTDWGYTKIVPPDVLEKIQPYIEDKECKK